MLCYAMLCYAMLCYAVLCYAMRCDAMRCDAMRCYAMLCYAMPCLLAHRRASLGRAVQPLVRSAPLRCATRSCARRGRNRRRGRRRLPLVDVRREGAIGEPLPLALHSQLLLPRERGRGPQELACGRVHATAHAQAACAARSYLDAPGAQTPPVVAKRVSRTSRPVSRPAPVRSAAVSWAFGHRHRRAPPGKPAHAHTPKPGPRLRFGVDPGLEGAHRLLLRRCVGLCRRLGRCRCCGRRLSASRIRRRPR
jgi:hypothetical protein